MADKNGCFVFNDLRFHSILQFFPITRTIEAVIQSPILNFQKDKLITGVELVDDKLLYWTDDFNEPGQINIERSKAGGYPGHEVAGDEYGLKVGKRYYGIGQIKVAAARDVFRRFPTEFQKYKAMTADEIYFGKPYSDLVNTDKLKQYVNDLKVKMYTENDAEYIAALINIEIRKNGRRIINSIKETMTRIKGGYASLLLMEDDNRLFAFRDPDGIRPLYIASITIADKKCVVFSSETCTFDIIKRYNEAKYGDINLEYREVCPGEIIAAHQDGSFETDYMFPKGKCNIGCVFETIYFSRPDSYQWNHSFQVLRERMGTELFIEAAVDADIVTSVPKGGIPSAVGYAKASKIPYAITVLEEPSIIKLLMTID